MGLNIGLNNISKLYAGSSEVSKVYFGPTLVWSSEAVWTLCRSNVPRFNVATEMENFINKEISNANFRAVYIPSAAKYNIYYTTSDGIDVSRFNKYIISNNESNVGIESVTTVINQYSPYELIFIQSVSGSLAGTIFYLDTMSWSGILRDVPVDMLDETMYIQIFEKNNYGTYKIKLDGSNYHFSYVDFYPLYWGENYAYLGEYNFAEETPLIDSVGNNGAIGWVVIAKENSQMSKVYYR